MAQLTFKSVTIFLVLTLVGGINLSHSEQLESRSLKCSEKASNGKSTLSCSGYPSVPIEIGDLEQSLKSQVQVLDLSNGNNLQTIKTAEFFNAGFHNLVHIKLSNNQIRTIDRGAFRDLDRLVEIDLSFNKIDSLDMEIFERNDALTILRLNSNPIHQFIGSMFSNLPSLRTIDLSGGRISKIPLQSFNQLTNLQELNLNDNQLSRLDWDVFKSVNTLSSLWLFKNPWQCNCHMKFLQDFLEGRRIAFSLSKDKDDMICSGPGGMTNKTWKEITQTELTCKPKITQLNTVGPTHELDDSPSVSDDQTVYTEIGKDIAFECVTEAYPTPEVKWLKNGKDIAEISRAITNNNARRLDVDNSNGNNNGPAGSGGVADEEIQLKYEERMNSIPMEEKYEKYNYKFTKLLRIYKADVADLAQYTCVVKNVAGIDSRKMYLNFTSIPSAEEVLIDPVLKGGGSKLWLWIIIGLICLIIIALGILCFGCWRRRQNKIQKALKQQMMEKFKDSHTDIGNSTFPQNQIKRDESNAPLLSPSEMDSRPKINPPTSLQIPDVALRNSEYERSLSPQVFSPRPPQMAANLRRQFFARQISEPADRPSRPESALSMYYYNTDKRQYGYLPQSHQNHPNYPGSMERYNNYNPIRRPGSSSSLVYPDSNYQVSRPPMMTRQYSGGPGWPSYATMRFVSRDRRPPSTSSFSSEPPLESGSTRPGFGYVTLPRTFGAPRTDSGFGRSLSPTGSNYSSVSYSTLPRRRIDPVTGVAYDSVGKRTTADGGSNLSLNKIGEPPLVNALESINNGLSETTKGKVKSGRNRSGSTTTPSSLRGRNEFFSFEPIPEVEGSDDVLAKLSSNNEIDESFQKLQTLPRSFEPRFKKKRPPPIMEIPPKSRKPIRTFEYAKFTDSPKSKQMEINGDHPKESSIDYDPNEVYVDEPLPKLPSSPPPKPQRLQNSLENIIGAVEGTEV